VVDDANYNKAKTKKDGGQQVRDLKRTQENKKQTTACRGVIKTMGTLKEGKVD